jgi:predicted alpha-1,2-mannosidase
VRDLGQIQPLPDDCPRSPARRLRGLVHGRYAFRAVCFRRFTLLALLATGIAGCGSDDAVEPAQNGEPPGRADLFAAIDPRIGTGGLGFGVGSAYPGPAAPFGMIHPSPDTRQASGAPDFYHCSGYYATDEYVTSFSLLHFYGTGVPDYGTMAFFPVLEITDRERIDVERQVHFAKSEEQTKPGYYSMLLDTGVRVEITASERAAIFRFGFPADGTPSVLIDLDHRLAGEVRAADLSFDLATSELSAHLKHFGGMTGSAGGYDAYAHAVFDVPPSAVGTWDAAGLHAGVPSAQGTQLGGWAEFAPGTRAVTMRVALSFVDAEGARKNLEAEAPDFDFDGMRAATEQKFKTLTDAVEIYEASAYDTTIMATAIYHTLLMPTLMSDVDGRFIDALGNVTQGTRARYNDFSLWDTYRTLHPWLLLSEHSANADFAASLVDMAREGGAVPVWGIAHGDSKTMIGSPGEIVLAESALKGIAFDDEADAYQRARVAAYGPSPGPVGGRDGNLVEYLALGYVPSDVSGGSVSVTQEYAVADAALARWAEKLGLTADAAELAERGRNYRHHYDSEAGFFVARKADGSFEPLGSPTRMSDHYVEGNAWHYLWMVPHDPDGLAELFGGREAALERLREFFELSEAEQPVLGVRQHYWPSNEPDLSAPWFFAAWGAPDESHRWVDWVVTKLYTDGVDGIPGNDDGGTMSAWLLFAAAGLYPLPGTDRYVISIPRYPRMVLHRAGGDLVIEATPKPAVGLKVETVTLDGAPLEGTTIDHAALAGEHTLRFQLR